MDCYESCMSSVKTLIKGEKINFFKNIYEFIDNSGFDCLCDSSSIVIPTTLSLSDTSVQIYYEDDLTTPIITDVPTETDIENSAGEIVGIRISYLVDTTDIIMSEYGLYLLIFAYTESVSGNTYIVKQPFGIKNISFC